jgi:hypothetical protein
VRLVAQGASGGSWAQGNVSIKLVTGACWFEEFLLKGIRLRLRNHMEKPGQMSRSANRPCLLRGIRLMVYNTRNTRGSVGAGNRRKNESNNFCPATATITVACILYPMGKRASPPKGLTFWISSVLCESSAGEVRGAICALA